VTNLSLPGFELNRTVLDVIPDLELIIGEQPKTSSLGASETQNRFLRVFQQFIGVFAQPEHPLVIFLDDLQWADLESLKLLQTLISDRDRQYLLIIEAYRDNEVSPTHPLMQTLEKIRSTGAAVNQIAIKPLEQQYVSQLVAETLGSGSYDSPSVRQENSFSAHSESPLQRTSVVSLAVHSQAEVDTDGDKQTQLLADSGSLFRSNRSRIFYQ
jgi:hypothetical protein